MPPFSQIIFEQQGPVGRLVLNRPEKRNAQTFEMWGELRQLGQQLLEEPGELAVVVVTGAGGCFSSGLDTSIFASGALASAAVDGKACQEAFSWLRAAPFITIAAMERFAIGAGLELALWCDMRIAAVGTVMSLPEVEYGIIPDLGGCTLLAEVCGYGRAIEIITTARKFDAADGYRLGIINEVVDSQDLQQRVTELTALLSKRSLHSLRGAKRATVAALPDTAPSLEVSCESIAACIRDLTAKLAK